MPSVVARSIMTLWLLSAAVGLAQAQSAGGPSIEISGENGTTKVSASTLAGFPRVEQNVVFQTSKGTLHARFEGVLLWDLLKGTGALDAAGGHPELRKTFVVTGRDGYSIAFSMGEISPEFGARAIMVAERADGKPLPQRDGLRLIVPGDVKGARSVRDVIRIDLR